VVDKATTTEEGQLAETAREEGLEQISKAAQGGEENEHSKEWLNIFSQEVEESIALKLTAKEAEGKNEHFEEWLDTFSQEAEGTTTWEFAEVEEEEEEDNICFVDLWE
jgi:rubrerythrin